MERSIETIWKEGFLKNDALVAPKLNDLYNKKSKHIIDKLKRMFKINAVYVVILSLVHVGIGIAFGIPFIGLYLALLLVPLIVMGKKERNKMEDIDNNVSSYQYLKTFNNWLQGAMFGYLKFYRYFYPLYFLGIILGILYSDLGRPDGENLIFQIMQDPEVYLVYGIPVFLIALVIIVIGVAAYFGGALYRLDVNIVYGRVFKKLDEIINDMEDLRAS